MKGEMQFLRECAKRLDEGESGESVLEDMRLRYTTLRCLDVKACLVRKLCTNRDDDGNLASNARALCLPREQKRECKRLARTSALRKNREALKVDGRRLLAAAREGVESVLGGEALPSLSLVLSLMLLTGRRTCEVVNAKEGDFRCAGEHVVLFRGQAKRRRRVRPKAEGGVEEEEGENKRGREEEVGGERGGAEEYAIPVLHPAERVLAALARARDFLSPPKEVEGVSRHQMASQKYQSNLRKSLLAHPVFSQVGRVHSLRGVYAKMAYALFDWDGDYSEAYVVMAILGHAGIQESLVYTPYHVGTDLSREPRLGRIALPPPFPEGEALLRGAS